MMIVPNYMMLIGLLAFCVGLILLVHARYIKSNSSNFVDLTQIPKKNNLPIVPRNQRHLIEMTNATPKITVSTVSAINHHNDFLSQAGAESHHGASDELSTYDNDGSFIDSHQESIDNSKSQDQDVVMQKISEEELFNHREQMLTIYITPKDGQGVLGETIIAIAKQYGMKYGFANLFHRYEKSNGSGMLWFSMIGVASNELKPFDILGLEQLKYDGLAFFLILPHPQKLRGFDSMVQVTQTIASELDADIHDLNQYIIDADSLKTSRNYVSDYESKNKGM